jgi:hypothetical protein
LLTCPKISLLLKTSLSKTKDGVFISGRLIFRVGGENEEK